VAESASSVRFGIANGPREDWTALVDFVSQAEALGFDSYWASDHPMLAPDCWTSLAGLAAITGRIRLGPLVSCVLYRNPAVLARMAADVDLISGGRLVLGLGSGDFAHEFAQLGIPWPATRARQAALEETVRIIRGLWGDGPAATPGTHVNVTAPAFSMRAPQQPRIPLLIGGGGEKVTLRQVARYADAANFTEHTSSGTLRGLDVVRRRLEALRRHCQSFGRPYQSVLRTHYTYPLAIAETSSEVVGKIERYVPPFVRDLLGNQIVAGTPRQVISYYTHLVRADLQYFIAFVFGDDRETLRLLSEHVIPAVRDPT
jgi:alkanesulfonate monooxygenase SsuD/methylene tetrahydromethanopterin reductase-like flavin-dependent oxidoreductase (luciferase family)